MKILFTEPINVPFCARQRAVVLIVASTPIPNEQTIPGLHPIPRGTLPSVPPPRPYPGAGAVLGRISGGKPSSGMQTPGQGVKKGRYSPPLRVPVIENRCTSVLFHLEFRELPSPFASSRETLVLSITPHAKTRRLDEALQGIIPSFAVSRVAFRVRPECPSRHVPKISKIR